MRPSFSNELGIGEAEAIALAVERKAVLIIDEPAGRRKAKHFGLQIVGTLGLLALAKKAGRITEVSPLVAKLQSKGYRLGDDLIGSFLKEMGESNKR